MSGWRVVAVVESGIIVGLVVALAMRTSANSSMESAREDRRGRLEAAAAQIQHLTAENAALRDARRRPRDGIERPPGEVPPDSFRSIEPDPNPTKPGQAPQSVETSADRLATARAQLRLLRIDLQSVLLAHDGEKAMGLLKQFSALARDLPEARDEAMKLALDINKDVQGAGELRLPMQVFYSGLGDPAIRDLMTWSLDNQASSSADFRVLSAWSLPYVLSTEDTIARFDAAFAHESDAAVVTALVRSLAGMNSAKSEPVLSKVLGDASRDAAVRGEAAMALSTSKDPAVQRAIDAAAAADPDQRLQSAQRISAVLRDPPAPGCLVLSTNADGTAAAAGMRPGDLIVSYNGRVVQSDVDLRRESQATSGAESVPVVVYRDGHEQTIHVKPGRLGITPKSVAKK